MKKRDRRDFKAPPPAPAAPLPAWKPVAGWAALVWILFVTGVFEQKYPVAVDPAFNFLGQWFDFSLVPFLMASAGYLKSLFFFALIVVGAVAWGTLLIFKFIDESTPLLARTVLSSLIGMILLSMIMTAAGFLGFLRPSYLTLLLFSFTAVGIVLARDPLGKIIDAVRSNKVSVLIDSPAKIALVVLFGFAFMMAFVPELFYDSLVYHLGLPQLFINEGRIIDTPNVYFSRSPMLIHMLYTLAVGVDGGSTLAKLINIFFLAVGVFGSFVICDRLGWRKTAAWAPILYLAIPIVQMNAWSTMVDSAMGGVFLMAAYSLLQWRESERKIFWAIMTGLLSGAVFAIKYPGLMVTALMGGVLFLLSVRKLKEKSILLSLVLYGIFAGATVSPWLIRNYVWTGNPVYPILSSVFESRGMHKEKMESEKSVTKRSKPESIGQLLCYPWTQTMKEMSNFNFIGPMMLSLLPLLIFLPFKDPSTRVFLLITFGYFFMELQVLGELRYIMPGFLLLGVVLAGGLQFLSESMPACGGLIKTAILGLTLYQLVWIVESADGRYKPVPLLLGKQSRQDYSATMHNGLNLWPWNAMMDDLKQLPEPCRIYILGDEQVFGFPKRFWYSSVHDHTSLVLWANASRDPEEFFEKMKSQGFTHLLLNVPEAMRLKSSELYPWAGPGRKNFVDFANQHLSLIAVKPIEGYPDSLFLFEIKDKLAGPLPFDFGVFFKNVYNLTPS